jgi:ApaG protein
MRSSSEERGLTPSRVQITVQTRFVPEQSDAARGVWLYAYTITITNQGTLPCQLLSRHWIITDAAGIEEHVRGEGVVGLQPRIGVGESFQYASACPLRTPIGSMRGSYLMIDAEGRKFEAEIAAFALAQRQDVN